MLWTAIAESLSILSQPRANVKTQKSSENKPNQDKITVSGIANPPQNRVGEIMTNGQCSYYGENLDKKIYTFDSDREADLRCCLFMCAPLAASLHLNCLSSFQGASYIASFLFRVFRVA